MMLQQQADSATRELLNNLSQKTPTAAPPPPRLVPVNYDPFATDNNSFARKGVGGDTRTVHMTNGDIGIPVEKQTPQLLAALASAMGGDLAPYTVGSGQVALNPNTGWQQFDAEGGGEGPGAEGGGNGNGNGPGSGAASDNSGADTGGGSGNKSSTAADETGGFTGASPSDLSADTSTGSTSTSSSGTKSSTAADETGGFTGISSTDYTGPATDMAGKIGEMLSRAWDSLTDLSDKGVMAKAVDFSLGVVTGGISTAANIASQAAGGKSIGQAMAAAGVSESASNPADPGSDPGLSGGGDGSGENDPAIHLAKLVAGMQDAGIRSPAKNPLTPATPLLPPKPVTPVDPGDTGGIDNVGFIDPAAVMAQQSPRKFF